MITPPSAATGSGSCLSEHVDVLIVGAGLSGVGAGCRLQQRCPDKTFAILEARGAIGGTWDLFRFPGIRSDSDMFTLCYPFRPWSGAQAIVDGVVDPRLRPRDGAGARDRPEDPLPPPRRGRRVVLGRRALDRGGRARRHRRDGPPDAAASCSRAPATTATTRATRPSFAGHRALRRRDRPSAVLDRRRRLRRQARGRDRQRRDRRDARSRRWPSAPPTSRCCSARPATSSRCPRRSARRPARARPADAARLSDRALEERAARARDLRLQPPPARGDEAADPQAARAPAPARLRHRHALQPALRAVGPAHVHRARRRPLRGDRRRPRLGRHRPHRDVHRDGPRARVRGPSSRPT